MVMWVKKQNPATMAFCNHNSFSAHTLDNLYPDFLTLLYMNTHHPLIL